MLQNPCYKFNQKIPSLPIINEFIGNDVEMLAFNFAIHQNEFIKAIDFCHQVGIICSFLRNPLITVSYEHIGYLFDKTRSTIFDQYNNYLRGDTPNGRPPYLNVCEVQSVIRYIQSCHTNIEYPIYPSYQDISDFIYQNFQK